MYEYFQWVRLSIRKDFRSVVVGSETGTKPFNRKPSPATGTKMVVFFRSGSCEKESFRPVKDLGYKGFRDIAEYETDTKCSCLKETNHFRCLCE